MAFEPAQEGRQKGRARKANGPKESFGNLFGRLGPKVQKGRGPKEMNWPFGAA